VSTSVNISQLLREVVDLLAPPPEVQVHFADNLPTIETQVMLLKQVVSNLIDNAIKYHDRSNGHIQILVIDQGSALKFTIIDDGPGIASEHHEKIFGIFQTLLRTTPIKGTGVGLAIVKKIVEGQGGLVWVEPDSQKGAAFSFTWLKNPIG
jgi:signal transduction histidine kinase